VDDIIFSSANVTLIQKNLSLMHGVFEMSIMGELFFILGLQIKYMKDDIFVRQIKYAKELLKRFRTSDSKPSKTSMRTNVTVYLYASGKKVDIMQYKIMISSLLYLTASRPNIIFVVCLYAQYQMNLKGSHLSYVKRIL
jgi:hypothetical protein